MDQLFLTREFPGFETQVGFRLDMGDDLRQRLLHLRNVLKDLKGLDGSYVLLEFLIRVTGAHARFECEE
jgi:hypothetical protein